MAEPKKRGGQPGNKNGQKNKIWSDAIRRELAGTRNQKKLNDLAKRLVDKALTEGDMQAFKEIGDRLEGKPAQMIEGTGEGGKIVIQLTGDDANTI